MDRAAFGAKFHSSDIMGAPLALVRLTQPEIDLLWETVSAPGKSSVSFGDVACFLSPSEEHRRYHWRDKILRGERRCDVAGTDESHVPSLAGHGNPLPVLSPHQRRRGAKGSAGANGRVGAAGGAWGVVVRGVAGVCQAKLGLPCKVDVDGGTVLLAADCTERGEDPAERMRQVIWLGRPCAGGGFSPVRDALWGTVLLVLLLTSAWAPSSPLPPCPSPAWGFVPYLAVRTLLYVAFLCWAEPSPGGAPHTLCRGRLVEVSFRR